MSGKALGGMDWPGLLRVGIGPARLGGLGLTPAQFWALTPAELALMIGPAPAGRPMDRDGLNRLLRDWPDEKGQGHGAG